MRSLIKELADRSTIIVSTHILQEVQAVCSRVMIIRSGRKALDARLEELQDHGRLLITTDAGMKQLQDCLGSTPQVQSIDLLSSGDKYKRYGLTLDQEADLGQATSARIAKSIIAADHQLVELHQEQRNLETLFGEITADEGRME